jgi:hypothetical protein
MVVVVVRGGADLPWTWFAVRLVLVAAMMPWAGPLAKRADGSQATSLVCALALLSVPLPTNCGSAHSRIGATASGVGVVGGKETRAPCGLWTVVHGSWGGRARTTQWPPSIFGTLQRDNRVIGHWRGAGRGWRRWPRIWLGRQCWPTA